MKATTNEFAIRNLRVSLLIFDTLTDIDAFKKNVYVAN